MCPIRQSARVKGRPGRPTTRHTRLARDYFERWAPRVGTRAAVLYAIAAEELMVARLILLGTTVCLFVGIQFTRSSALVYVLELMYLVGFLVVVRSGINQRRARRLAAEALGIEPRIMRAMNVRDATYTRWCKQH